jgi:hypothetical protein
MTLKDSFPQSSEGWLSLAALLFGGLLSWLAHPGVWLVAGPFRWLAMLAATASQESGFNREAVGDAGRSVGILQFYDSTWQGLGYDLENRTNCAWQGWAAGAYVQAAIADDLRWLAIVAPVYGFPLLRVLWTSGPGAWDRGAVSEGLARVALEGRAPSAWRTWRVLSFVALAGAVALVRSGRK